MESMLIIYILFVLELSHLIYQFMEAYVRKTGNDTYYVIIASNWKESTYALCGFFFAFFQKMEGEGPPQAFIRE